MGRFSGHIAVVTGGASGIGAATCRRLASEGARVAVLDRDLPGAESVAAQFDGLAVGCDVAHPEQVDEAFARIASDLGPVSDLVNNAGFGMNQPLHTYTNSDWQAMIDINLAGPFYCMRSAIPVMLAEGRGCIVNNASINAVRPMSGEGPYSAAKAGLVNLTMDAALEYASTIRANCVSPALIETPLTEIITSNPEWRAMAERDTPAQRIGTAEEVAAVIAFLCSDDASYVTGQNIVIDGGAGIPNAQADFLINKIFGRA